MNPIKSTLKHPVVALVVAALLVTVGLHAFFTMPKTEDPSITIRTGLILVQYSGATFEDVKSTYITSALTRSSVPLRSMATLTP